MSPDEWGALRWWQQRLYEEGLESEFGDSGPTPNGEPQRKQEATQSVVFDGTPGEFGAWGFNERNL